jgi:hypothetical protein
MLIGPEIQLIQASSPERFYMSGAILTAFVYAENVHDWWSLDKFPSMVWRSLVWPWYLPKMLLYGVPLGVAPLPSLEAEEEEEE